MRANAVDVRDFVDEKDVVDENDVSEHEPVCGLEWKSFTFYLLN